MEQDFNIKHWAKTCPKYDCRKDNCKCGMSYVNIPAVLGSDAGSSPVAPKNGAYCNAIVKYEANGNVYAYSKDGIPVFLGSENSRLVTEKMMVTFTPAPEGSEYEYTWSSDYSFEELSENPDNIRVGMSQLWLCAGDTSDVIPERVTVTENDIGVDVRAEDFRYTYWILKPVSKNGVTINPGWFGGGKVLKNSVDVIVLPQLELEYPATEIPDGTTYVTSSSVNRDMYNTSTSDCMPLEQTITGHFMILPVRRNTNSGGYGWAIEECLITEVSHPWTGNAYRYKTFCFNGQKYKMTYTSMSGNNITWTISKMEVEPPAEEVINLSVVIDDGSWGQQHAVYSIGVNDTVGIATLSAAQGNQGLFKNDDSGEFVTEKEAYELIASGKRVKFNHVPVGQRLESPHAGLLGLEYVNGIELTNEYVTNIDGAPVSIYSATVSFELFASESGILPPLGVFLQKIDQDPYEDTYEFMIQGRYVENAA